MSTAGATLTFLFTDVEASSRRWEEHPEAMSAALSRHDELLAAAMTGCGGTVFKHTGDGICAVFPAASQAVGAALAGQQALQSEDWGELGDLPVRMALHTGTAEHRGGDYFGPALNRTARLLDSAHGGQTVVSLAAAELAAEDLPAKAELVDLGEHRLADLSRPERVFQLAHPDLAPEFPPLRSLGAHRHNLPAATSTFVGRDREVAEVAALVRAARLVTLTGAGGTGKTRLALAAAGGLVGEYPDGVFLVELAALADPELVAAEVQAALGVVGDEAGARPAGTAERVARYLATRRALVILDNCEHVLDAASRLAQMVLDRAPGVAVLATSREALGLPGERSWRVPSLSLPAAGSSEPGALGGSDAVTLFCERARVADPSFRLTTANAGAVAGICRRLDGLPLALELAAARLRVLSAEQVAERLDDRFRLLTGGARSALPRHRTLRAAIDWSWDLLSDAERALLRRLTVFPGSFSLAAAETVGADGEAVRSEDVLDLLAALADKSLLGVESGGHEARYSLSQTIREYAAEFLAAAGEADTTRDRHLEHYLDLARRRHSRQLFGGEGWLAFLASDYDNLRAVLEWCRASGRLLTGYRMAGALSGFWAWDGRFEEGRAWLGWALGGGAELPARTRGRLLSALAQVLNQQGDLAGATAAVEEALMLAGVADDDTGRVQALAAASELALQRGDVAESRRLLAAGWAGSESLGQEAVAYYETGFGWVAVAEGDLHTARARFEASLESFRAAEAGDDLATPGVRPSPERGGDVGVYAAGNLAPVLAALGEVDRAHDLVAGALARAHELGRGALVMARVRAAETWIIAGHPDQAREHVLDALSLLREMGGRAWVADALELAAIVIAGDGQAGPAVRVAAAAGAIREAVGGSGRFRLVHDALKGAVGEGVHSLGPAAAQERATGRALSATQALTFARDHLASG